jgi:REP element-mobilizing transposase RayT
VKIHFPTRKSGAVTIVVPKNKDEIGMLCLQIQQMPDKFLHKYRIPSARLPTWDYSSNATYFLTICTAGRQHYFGEILNSEMQLSKIGEYASKCWMEIPAHFPYFYLDESVVMPNHIHGIILIERPYFVETRHALSLQKSNYEQSQQSDSPHEPSFNIEKPKPPHFRFRNQGKNTISAMVGSFKSAVSKFGNENNQSFGWQSRFHDHIIRDKDEYNRIKDYIINNPRNWEKDQFYTL